jgi:hypothetical protein
MNFENFDIENNTKEYLYFFTGQKYCFAESSSRVWTNSEIVEQMECNKPFYQLMPETLDDGFFDWYCFNRPDNQFFKTREMCVLYFIKYWTDWVRIGKPEWK